MGRFDFEEPETLRVFVCKNVLEGGMPVLFVSRDEDGDWQFLCGGEHGEDSGDEPALICLEHIVERDQTLNELATLCPLHDAEREELGGEWRIHDGMEDVVLDNVQEHACHVMLVSADDGEAAFAYSIGLPESFAQPELLISGLKSSLMHWMINAVRDRMQAGERFADGDRVSGLLDGYECVLEQMHPSRYRDYLGYALWFHDGEQFETLQIVWPSKSGHFPWDEGYPLTDGDQARCWIPAP